MTTGELLDVRKLSQVGASIILSFRIQTMHEISELTLHQAFAYTGLPLLCPVIWFMPFAKLLARILQAPQNTSRSLKNSTCA